MPELSTVHVGSAPMEPFHYSPLDRGKKEFRLLRFNTPAAEPSGSPPSSPRLSLTLSQVSRYSSCVNYVAVSYVWGRDDAKVAVEVNGQHFSIGANLFEILQQLRARGVTADIWADAICINQADNAEKSWQVNDMKSIFEGAARVYIHLGAAADDSDFAIDWLCDLARQCEECGVKRLLDRPEQYLGLAIFTTLSKSFPQWALSTKSDDLIDILRVKRWGIASSKALEDALASYVEEEIDVVALKFIIRLQLDADAETDQRFGRALESMLLRDLWHRVWIFQEIAVARNGVFVCGDRDISVADFNKAFSAVTFWNAVLQAAVRKYLFRPRFFINGNLKKIPQLAMWEAIQVGNSRPMHWGPGRLLQWDKSGPSLQSFLLLGMGNPGRPVYSATDPRDIIYALLGLTSASVILGIQADYDKAVEQVFSEATRAIIFKQSHQADVKLITYAVYPKTLASLPSWVPDWKGIGEFGLRAWPVGYGARSLRPFLADGGRRQPADVEGDDDRANFSVLRLCGVRVTTIEAVLDPPQWKQPPGTYGYYPTSMEGRQWWLQRAVAFAGCEPDHPSVALCRVLLHNLKDSEHRQTGYSNEVLMNFIRSVISTGNASGELFPDLDDLDAMMDAYASQGRKPSDRRSDRLKEITSRILAKVETYLRGRTLVKTADGVLGRATDNVKAGDVAAILWGVNTPVIIRPSGDGRYEYVGDAFIDGIMHGEFLETSPSEEVFDLI